MKCYTVSWTSESEGISYGENSRIGKMGNYCRVGDGIFEDLPLYREATEDEASPEVKGVITQASLLPKNVDDGDEFPIIVAPREDDLPGAILVYLAFDVWMTGSLISCTNEGAIFEDETCAHTPYRETMLVMPAGSRVRQVFKKGRISILWDGINLKVVRQ